MLQRGTTWKGYATRMQNQKGYKTKYPLYFGHRTHVNMKEIIAAISRICQSEILITRLLLSIRCGILKNGNS